MKKTVIVLMIIIMPTIALASFSIKLENTFNKKMYYLIYWVDHPYSLGGPANMAGGELEGLASLDIPVSYDSGNYFIIWRDTGQWQNKVQFIVESGVRQVTLSPEKADF
jgi:hypothetical protein